MSEKAQNIYDIIENEKGEILILLYEGKEAPENPSYFINKREKYIRIARNSKDIVLIEDINDENIKKISAQPSIYICELKYDETLKEGDESEIVYAYIALPKAMLKLKAKEEKTTPSKTTDTPEKKEPTSENEKLKEKITKIKENYQNNKETSPSKDANK